MYDKKTGRSKGMGIVRFAEEASYTKAFEKDDFVLLVVDFDCRSWRVVSFLFVSLENKRSKSVCLNK